MSRQGIVVCGYYGFGNVGDEAVLAGFAHGLRQAGYDAPITALSADPSQTRAEHGVEAIPRTDLRAVWRALRRSQVFVLGGGSLLQDVTSARSIVYYLGMHALARRAGCRVLWVGQGIGPLRRSWARRWTARAARQAEAVVVRDPESAQMLRAMGVPKVQEGADLSFLLPDADTEYGRKLLSRWGVPEGTPVIGLAPREWREAQTDVVGLFRTVADYVQKELGTCPFLLPMHWSRDKTVAERIGSEVPGAVVPDAPPGVREVQDVLACCEAVVGVRLHALMLAASSGAPALAISYDPKVRAFWGQVAPEYVMDVKDLSEDGLKRKIRELWANREALRVQVQSFAVRQRELAQRNVAPILQDG